MDTKRATASENRVLGTLPSNLMRRVLDNSETVKLNFGDAVSEYGEKTRHVYFPLDCLISLVICIDDRAPFELAMIGNDGMLGASEALGVGEAPMRAIVHGEGYAMKMDVRKFKELLDNGSHLQSTVKRYLFELMSQINRTAGCSQFHRVSSRLARWLLLTSDRSGVATCSLTQQFLSEILGVQRSAVSIAASVLQDRQLISYSRGLITILDRSGLEAESCSCYSKMAQGPGGF